MFWLLYVLFDLFVVPINGNNGIRENEDYVDYRDQNSGILEESHQDTGLLETTTTTATKKSNLVPPDGHVSGGLPMISDSAFSLVILVYVSVSFLCVFFLFCWRTGNSSADDLAAAHGNKPRSGTSCPLLTSADQIGNTKCNNNKVMNEPTVIPPTPPAPASLIGIDEEATQV